MKLANKFCFIAAAASVAVMPLRIHSQDSQTRNAKTVWDGVFSEDQARRGRASYNASCGSCHRADLTGYEGVLKGQKFIDRWREDALESLYSNIKRSMPRNAPGALDTATYLDIIAYILEQNGFPAGLSELSSDNLKGIHVTGQNGPESLPIGALVQVYGCISENPANSWTLIRATNAVRTRNPDKSSDADLKQAELKLPAGANYRLIDAAFYHAERYKDQFAEVKGFLVADPADGISVTSVAPLSTPCS
jgi:S-disulfanyl-L-cysteine oxidoreductase SoxD